MASLLKSLFRSTECCGGPRCLINVFASREHRNISCIRLFCDNATTVGHSKKSLLDYIQFENEHMHQLLAADRLYVRSIAFLDFLKENNFEDINSVMICEPSNLPVFALLNHLKTVFNRFEQHPDIIHDPKVTEICKQLQNKVIEASDEHFWLLMKVLCLWPNRERDQRFFDFCKAIDEEAIRRLSKWGYDSILLTMDHFYRMRVVKYCEFFWYGMKRLWRNPGKLSPQQVVHAMFLVNTHRRWHPSVDPTNVESVLMHYIYDLSVEEVGILAVAFFKTEKPVININLVEKMYNKLSNRIEDVNSLTLCSYLKFFRLCTPTSLKHKMIELLDSLDQRIDDLSIPCCTHIALLGTNKIIRRPELLKRIAEKFYSNIESTRLKDMERLTYALQKFNFIPDTEKNIFIKIMEELHHREKEIEVFPRVFLSTLHYLALKNYFDYELINKGLSDTFLKSAFRELSPYTIPEHVLHLSTTMKLECPNYKGNLLDEGLSKKLWKKFSLKIPDVKNRSFGVAKHLLSIKNVGTVLFGGPEFVHLVHILPYFGRADVICCLKDGEPIQLPQEIRNQNFIEFGPPLDLGGTWYAIVSLDKNVTIFDTSEPCGPLNAKLHQLKLLGYKPVLISENTWTSLDTDKEKYLKQLIHGCS